MAAAFFAMFQSGVLMMTGNTAKAEFPGSHEADLMR
jgi:hypothetical protein